MVCARFSVSVSVELDEEMLEVVKKVAEELGIAFSDFIRTVVVRVLESA